MRRFPVPSSFRRALVGGLALVLVAGGCRDTAPRVTRLDARPADPTEPVQAGARPLDLGTTWYRGMRRDGMLLVPSVAVSGRPVPLLVLLHGGGGRANDFRFMLPLGEELGVALLLLDARHNTWDGIDSAFGPDVHFLDEALRHTFARVPIDPRRIALGGMSDGGMYALSIGLINGDLVTHVFALAAGFMNPPGPRVGRPRILLAHGTRDTVYSVRGTRDRLQPQLKAAGYDVEYLEFDGPHFITPPVARAAIEWLAR